MGEAMHVSFYIFYKLLSAQPDLTHVEPHHTANHLSLSSLYNGAIIL